MSENTSEIIKVTENKVACDGDGGALGHPRVYLTLDKIGQAECPYCDRLYVKEGGPADNS